MGMTGWQVLLQVEVPMALPLILLGLRIAAIQVVATATVAAYAGLGGLGRFIVDGLARKDYACVDRRLRPRGRCWRSSSSSASPRCSASSSRRG